MNHRFDITISGAGPAGMACAAMISSLRPDLTIALIDAKAEITQDNSRHLALSHGSIELLKNCLLWPKDKNEKAVGTPIYSVHVSQMGRLGHTLMQASTLGVPELGWMMNYSALNRTLNERLLKHFPKLSVFRPNKITAQLNEAQGLTLVLADGQSLNTRLLVHAEGGVFHKPDEHTHDTRDAYGQTAVLCVVNINHLPNNHAWERFTPHGPVAMLPLGEHRFSLVWCVANDEAQGLINDTVANKQKRLAHIFAHRFSDNDVIFETQMQAYPLGIAWKNDLIAPHTVTLGNAAQTLHPVAGQGLNLALRDCQTLAHMLASQDNWPVALTQYATLRTADRNTTRKVTDAMARVFATPNAIAQHALGIGLLGLDVLRPTKRWVGNSLLWGQR